MNVHDIINEADLYDGSNVTLTQNRFNKSDSALSLTQGYYKMPPRVYFNGNFSLLTWVKIKQISYQARLIEVSNGRNNNNLAFILNYQSTLSPYFRLFSGSTTISLLKSSQQLEKDKWQHVTFVLSLPNVFIYIDGQLVGNDTATDIPMNVTRSVNYLGRSMWSSLDTDLNADLDELKIFNRALTKDEILFEMNNEIFI